MQLQVVSPEVDARRIRPADRGTAADTDLPRHAQSADHHPASLTAATFPSQSNLCVDSSRSFKTDAFAFGRSAGDWTPPPGRARTNAAQGPESLPALQSWLP